jgi:hypothetical protein
MKTPRNVRMALPVAGAAESAWYSLGVGLLGR